MRAMRGLARGGQGHHGARDAAKTQPIGAAQIDLAAERATGVPR